MDVYSFAPSSSSNPESPINVVFRRKEEYIRRLKGLLRTLGTNNSRLDQFSTEIFQDTVEQIVRAIQSGRYQEQGKLDSFFMGIARNLAKAYYRKWNLQCNSISDTTSGDDRLFVSLSDDTELDKVYDVVTNSSHPTLKCHLQASIKKVLNPSEQRILNSFYFEGLQTPEIASHYGLSSSNVKTTLCRARKKLHQLLSPKRDQLFGFIA